MLYNVKAGIVGLEDLGMQFASLINDHVKNLNLIAASGRTQKELLYAKNELSLEYVYGDEKALFDNHDIDAVLICADPRFRANLAIQAIDKGKHVFLLNPLALNVDDAQSIWKTADSHPSQFVMCASMVSSLNFVSRIQHLVNSANMGKLEHVEIDSNFISSINKKHGSPSGSKYLDRLLDEIEFCQHIDHREFDEVEVTTYRSFKMAKALHKGRSLWQLNLLNNKNARHGFLSMSFEEGRLMMSNDKLDEIHLYHAEGKHEIISTDPEYGFNYPEYLQLHHFTQCILGKEKNKLKLTAPLEAMKLALAFEKADVLGEKVIID